MSSTLRKLLPLMALGLLAACAGLPERPELPPQAAIAPGQAGPLDERIGAAEALHAGESGFRLLSEGPEAFVVRAYSARLAARSIDVQTYIWHADLTGSYLANELLAAADRGVRVRLLVDDIDARAKSYGFAALDAHPNIEVRMFNPLASRQGTLSMAFEFAGGMKRLNRRMHNKSWIVDNRLAVAGGRNLGEEYFGASVEVNFIDLDLSMVGPVVRDVSASFDRFWNSEETYPIALLSPEGATPAALATLRPRLAEAAEHARTSRYAEALRSDAAVQRLLAGEGRMTWVSDYRFVSDRPGKVRMEASPESSDVAGALRPLLNGAEHTLAIISPYFVPGERGTAWAIGTQESGTSVRIITNSLAANDVAVVHGGYSRYRRELLEGGVRLWELKPAGDGQLRSSLFGSSGASLHTKALVVDESVIFVGSFNLDPRSVSLNTEQGVIVHSPELAAKLGSLFSQMTSGERAWEVSLTEDGQLAWSDGRTDHDREPEASAWRRFQAWLARVLPVESQL